MAIAAKVGTMMERLGAQVTRLAEQTEGYETSAQPMGHVDGTGNKLVTISERDLTGRDLLDDNERKKVVKVMNDALERAGFSQGTPEPFEDIATMRTILESKGAVTLNAVYQLSARSMKRLSESWDAVTELTVKYAKQTDLAREGVAKSA